LGRGPNRSTTCSISCETKGAHLSTPQPIFADLLTPTVRLGVTGLSRAGKTVFITALVRNLVSSGRLPFFTVMGENRFHRAYLEPQPDDDVPRFPYEDHLARLAADPPQWPAGTTRISQLRVTIEYTSKRLIRSMTGRITGGVSRLHVDIVDYPGEWIVDLALLGQDYAAWANRAVVDARAPDRRNAAQAFLAFVDDQKRLGADAEQVAIEGARLFTQHLSSARAAAPSLSALTPGRFLMPGDLDGSPLLTFFPLPEGYPDDSLRRLLAQRFESYKSKVVRPFFRDHFAKLDRQIVLMDALSALNRGPAGVRELADAMALVLEPFRTGAKTFGLNLFRPRIDKLVFAATKADHLNRQSHERLEALMRVLANRAILKASDAGANVQVLAMAAIRSTREAEVTNNGEALPCIVGVPLAGEHVGDVTFDGKTETALFPGDLPADPSSLLLDKATGGVSGDDVRALTFRPPRLILQTGGGQQPAPPHIRLDRALEFLIGDRLK
jgi:uncharacterized protein